jgi:hypothetical protein
MQYWINVSHACAQNVTLTPPPPPQRAPTPPPPPPGPPAPPAAPNATTIVLEVFYQAGQKNWLLTDCSGSALIFSAAVQGPSFTQVCCFFCSKQPLACAPWTFPAARGAAAAAL